MIENLSIIKLTEKDFEGAYEVIKITIPYAYNLCDLEADEEVKAMINYKRDLMKQSISNDEPIFFIAKHNDKVIGTISFTTCSEDIKICTNNEITDLGEMGGLYILPEYQGKGIGSTLINYLIAYLKKQGIEEVCLESGYKQAQPKWIRKFGEPYVIAKDYWAPGLDNMVWKYKI